MRDAERTGPLTRVPDSPAGFHYDNRSPRPPGRFITLAGHVLPGIARVQADVEPFAAAWREANRAALAAPGPLWVAIGDSLTQGIGAPAFDRGWVGQLHHRLRGRGLRLVNLSVSGARTQDVLDHQLPALARLARAVAVPELITVMIGSNDLVNRRHRDGVEQRLDRILRQLPPGSVVTTMPNPTAVAERMNAVLRRAAADRSLVVAELRDARTTSWRGKLAADHFHPNEAGYRALSDVVGDAMGLPPST